MIGDGLNDFDDLGELVIDESDATEVVSCSGTEPSPKPDSNAVSVTEATDANGNPHIRLRVSLKGARKMVQAQSQKRSQHRPSSPPRKYRRRGSDASRSSTGTTGFDVERPRGTSPDTGVPDTGETK
jgi:hypothetical protein